MPDPTHTAQMTTNLIPSNHLQAMSEYTVVTKYARYNEKQQRRETWDEMVDRVRDMHLFRYGTRGLNDEISWSFEQVRDRKVLPSMRSLQYGGDAIIANDARMYNCAFSLADRPRFFSECLWLLLSGTGTGFSVQKQHVAKLPKLIEYHDATEKEVMTYTVGDTIEGWADALQMLMDSYFAGTPLSNKEIFFDYTRIRRKGTKLRTSGGKAPGPKPLQRAIKRIKRTLIKAVEGGQEKLRPIQVYDIITMAADCVLAGGIRKSATIALFSPDDAEMMEAKIGFHQDVKILTDVRRDGSWLTDVGVAWDLDKSNPEPPQKGDHCNVGWYNLYPWRQLSNNSAALLRKDCKFEDFDHIIDCAKSYGEPGFVFLDNLDYGYNPCFSGDCKILTDDGLKTIKELWESSGKHIYDRSTNVNNYGTMTVINSYGKAKSTNVYKTSNNSVVFEVILENDESIKTTENHTFIKIEDGSKIRLELKDLRIGDNIPLIDGTISKVKSITKCGVEPTYCLTEFENNEVCVNNIIIGQCVEIGLNPVDPKTGETGWQTCVSGDTSLLTRTGKEIISEVVGKKIEIWNGSQWSTVEPRITGRNRKLYRVEFSDGSYLDCTDNHKFLVADRFQKSYSTVETKDLKNFSKYDIHIPRSNIEYDGCGGKYELNAYEYGFILGDGSVTTKNYTGKVYAEATLCGSKIDLQLTGNRKEIRKPDRYNVDCQPISFSDINEELCIEMKDFTIGLPNEIFRWNYDSIISFISGWADADGSAHNNGCRIYGSELKIRDLQLLLTKVGINSSVCLMSKKDEVTNFGTRSRDVWYVYIPNASKLNTNRIDVSKGEPGHHKAKWQRITSVEKLPGLHTTYCLNEPINHTCVFNNVLTKQCNLTEINGGAIKSKDDFRTAVKAATIIGTLQAGYSYFSYLSDASRNIIRREALLGVSVTGWMDNPRLLLDPELQREMAQYAVEINKEYAKKIEISQAARVTCTKPAGTTSIVLGTGSGIHPHHARYYFRRVRMNKTERPLEYFKLYNPKMVEPSVSNDYDEIITFCVQVPESAILKKDVNAVDFLKMVKKTYENWVVPGTANPNSSPGLTHNVSNTVTIKADEWEEVARFIYDNRQCFSGISMLADFGDKAYRQAPMERVESEEDIKRWNEMVENYQPVDWSLFHENDDYTEIQMTVACANGKCEIA